MAQIVYIPRTRWFLLCSILYKKNKAIQITVEVRPTDTSVVAGCGEAVCGAIIMSRWCLIQNEEQTISHEYMCHANSKLQETSSWRHICLLFFSLLPVPSIFTHIYLFVTYQACLVSAAFFHVYTMCHILSPHKGPHSFQNHILN